MGRRRHTRHAAASALTALVTFAVGFLATPAAAAPGGRIFAVAAGHGIYSMLGNGADKTLVVPDAIVSAFAAAPDGLVMAYADAGAAQLHVTAANGNSSSPITVPIPPGATVTSIAWSPDSARLAFDYCASGACGVDVSDLSGDFIPVWLPNASRLSPSGGISWSPNGLVAAMSELGCSTCSPDLYSLGVDGSNPQLILAGTPGTAFDTPTVSPDGRTLAYTVETTGQSPVVETADMATGNRTQLFQNGSDPAWAPDGTALAYTNGYQVFGGASGGRGTELLTSFPYYGLSDLSWVPSAGSPPGGCAVALTNGAAEGIAASATGHGYWVADAYGTVSACGDAAEHGGIGGVPLNQPVIGIASTSDHGGYWLAAYDGGVFSFGDASSLPLAGSPGRISLSGLKLSAPVYGMASDPAVAGFWLVATDGGVFTFGKAPFYGSAGGLRLAAPVVGMAATPDGRGYWLLGRDGGVFSYGDAPYAGGGVGRLATPAVAIVSCPAGGYWIVEADGTVLSFGGAPSLAKAALTAPAVSAAATPTGAGMWVVDINGQVAALGDAPAAGSAG